MIYKQSLSYCLFVRLSIHHCVSLLYNLIYPSGCIWKNEVASKTIFSHFFSCFSLAFISQFYNIFSYTFCYLFLNKFINKKFNTIIHCSQTLGLSWILTNFKIFSKFSKWYEKKMTFTWKIKNNLKIEMLYRRNKGFFSTNFLLDWLTSWLEEGESMMWCDVTWCYMYVHTTSYIIACRWPDTAVERNKNIRSYI